MGQDIDHLKKRVKELPPDRQRTGYPRLDHRGVPQGLDDRPYSPSRWSFDGKTGNFAQAFVAHSVAEKVKRSAEKAGVPFNGRQVFEQAVSKGSVQPSAQISV